MLPLTLSFLPMPYSLVVDAAAPAFTGRLLRLAARFSPPEMAFEYRPRAGAARCVFAVSVTDLADPSVPLSPEAAASRLLARCDWPFPRRLISRPQLARLLGLVRAAQTPQPAASLPEPSAPAACGPDTAPADPAPAASCDAMRESRASAVSDPSEAVAVAGAVSGSSSAATQAVSGPRYCVSRQQRARAESRYVQRGDAYAHGLIDLRLSASGGPTLLRLAADELDDDDGFGYDDKLEVGVGESDDEDERLFA